jgi:hypothetical protein
MAVTTMIRNSMPDFTDDDRSGDLDTQDSDLDLEDEYLADVGEDFLDPEPDGDAPPNGRMDASSKQAPVTKLAHLVVDNLATDTAMVAAAAEDTEFSSYSEGADSADLLTPIRSKPQVFSSAVCRVCLSSQTEDIDRQLRAGASPRAIGEAFGLSGHDVSSHKYRCLGLGSAPKHSGTKAADRQSTGSFDGLPDWERDTAELVESPSSQVGTGYAVRLPAGVSHSIGWREWLRDNYPEFYVYAWNADVLGLSQDIIAQAFGTSRTTVTKGIERARLLYEHRGGPSFLQQNPPGAPPRMLHCLLGEAKQVFDFVEIVEWNRSHRTFRDEDSDYDPGDEDAFYKQLAARGRSIWDPSPEEIAAQEREHDTYHWFMFDRTGQQYLLWELAHFQHNRTIDELARKTGWDPVQVGVMLECLWAAFREHVAAQGNPVRFPCPHLLPKDEDAGDATPKVDGRHVRGEAKLQQILDAIRALTAEHGCEPTQVQVQKYMGLSSRSELTSPIKRLREQGRLAPDALIIIEG